VIFPDRTMRANLQIVELCFWVSVGHKSPGSSDCDYTRCRSSNGSLTPPRPHSRNLSHERPHCLEAILFLVVPTFLNVEFSQLGLQVLWIDAAEPLE
jgi:hypothetical protein